MFSTIVYFANLRPFSSTFDWRYLGRENGDEEKDYIMVSLDYIRHTCEKCIRTSDDNGHHFPNISELSKSHDREISVNLSIVEPL